MAGIVKELWAYMGARKKWWLMPVIVVLVLFGGLLMAVAPQSLDGLLSAISGFFVDLSR